MDPLSALASTPPGMPGTHTPIFWLGGRQREYPPILLCTFGYSRPILAALRSLSLKPIPFGYKTPPIRFSQAGGQSAHKARPPNLELALTPLFISKSPLSFPRPLTTWHCSPLQLSAGRAAVDRYLLPAAPTLPDFIRDPSSSTDGFRRLLKT